MKICRKLEGKQINLKDLHTFLTSYFSPGHCIPHSGDIHEIFETISSNKLWDYWNYLPLKKIVEGFAADDEEIASWIEDYKQDLKSFKVTTKLFECIANASSNDKKPSEKPPREYYQKISIKLGAKVTDRSLEYIDDVWNEIAGLYDLPPHAAILESICKGCVLIVWRIPSHIAPKILEAPPPSDEFYRKYGITRMEYGGEGIYQEGEVHV